MINAQILDGVNQFTVKAGIVMKFFIIALLAFNSLSTSSQSDFPAFLEGICQTESKMDKNKQSMESKILGLRTAIYKVADLNTAKEWYTTAFQTEPYYDESYYVGFNIGGFELGLLPDSTSAQDKSEGVVAYWGVDDIVSEYNRIIGLGAVGHEPPKNVGGEIIVATVKDPWGNVIGLIYNPEFKIGSE